MVKCLWAELKGKIMQFCCFAMHLITIMGLPRIFKGEFSDSGNLFLWHKFPSGVLHWHGIHICVCLFGRFFAKFGLAIEGGVSSETKEPQLQKLFWAVLLWKTPNLVKIGCFSFENGILMGGKLGNRERQMFEVRQAHQRTILVKVTPNPPPPRKNS